MTDFRPSYKGLGEMLRSPAMQVAMHKLAEKVAARAEAIAPFDPDDPDGRHYKDAFEVSSGVRRGLKSERAYGRVTNTDSAARYVEYGAKEHEIRPGQTISSPKHRTLGRALDALRE